MKIEERLEIGTELFGEAVATHIPVLDALVREISAARYRYHFMSSERYGLLLKDDWRAAQRIYWLEIVCRAHFSACTSLIRSKRWLDAVLYLAAQGNYTAFAGAYRGWLEAAADSYFSFDRVTAWLADAHVVVREALDGSFSTSSPFKELEDELIHFSHGRHVKKGENVDDAHRALQTAKYLNALADEDRDLATSCYRTLCDVSHPGAGSIRCYIGRSKLDVDNEFTLTTAVEPVLIREFCTEFNKVSGRVSYLALIPAAVLLRLATSFDIPGLEAPFLSATGVEKQYAWLQVEKRLNDQARPAGQEFTG